MFLSKRNFIEIIFLFILRVLKFYFSLCALNNAIVFKSIDAEDINNVEQFIRSELDLIIHFQSQSEISGDKQKTRINGADKIHFYGDYGSKPSKFKFSIVERKLIELLVAHVKHVVDVGGIDNNNQMCHFSTTDLVLRESTDFSQIGCYFGDTHGLNNQLAEREETSTKPTKTHYFLNKLMATADKNSTRDIHGYRYDDETKQFAAYFRMLAGPFAYETIQANLECALPSLATTNRYIRRTNCNIVEGILRIEELLLYLEQRNLPLVVSLSEDATRIEGKIQYDLKTNQMIGFVLPINHQTGMPIPYSYNARNASEIFEHFASGNEAAHFVNVIMGQPLAKVAPFCLLIYGSNGKYTTEDVSKKWLFIVDQLKNVNITVLSISSDSDPKYNSAMRKNSHLGLPCESSSLNRFGHFDWFSCGNYVTMLNHPFYVQDTIHIGTKLRNFFLKTKWKPNRLPFGKKYFIKMQHLDFLLENFSKVDHMLCSTTLNPIDRQNFLSVSRMCDKKVTDLLRSDVPMSEGTATFLDIMRDVIAAYMDCKLMPLERIKKYWYSLFLIRMWRDYIVSNKKLTLKENFLTQNCYSCIELNAHSLVLLLIHLKEINMPELFTPHLYSSQPCEALFRMVRSFTSTYSTVANCSVKEILGRINKIQLQSDIATHNAENFIFPRVANASSNIPKLELPTTQEIYNQIERCKTEAIEHATKIGLVKKKKSQTENWSCKVVPYVPKPIRKTKNSTGHSYCLSEEYLYETLKVSLLLKSVSFKNWADKFSSKRVGETTPYVELDSKTFNRNKKIIVKKSFLSWLLRTNNHKLSSDRLERVKSKIHTPKKIGYSNNSAIAHRRLNINVKPYRKIVKY